jgi:hypothetical protein
VRPAITQGGVALIPSEADAGHVDSGNDPILLFVIRIRRSGPRNRPKTGIFTLVSQPAAQFRLGAV